MSLSSMLVLVTGSAIVAGCADRPTTTVVEKIDVPLPKSDLLVQQSPPRCGLTAPPPLAQLGAPSDINPPQQPSNDWSPFRPQTNATENTGDGEKVPANQQQLVENQNAAVAQKIASERECYSKAEKSVRDRLGGLQSAVKTTINAIKLRNDDIERQQLANQSRDRIGAAGGEEASTNGLATR
jgi:hypothetical protein